MISDRILLIGMWLQDVRNSVTRRIGDQLGQGIMEYAILVGAIALIAGAAFYATDLDFGGMWDNIEDCINFSSGCGENN